MWIKRLVIFNIAILHVVLSEDVGDKCMVSDQQYEGTCTEVSKCDVAKKAIKDKKFHQFQRCGFSGFEEIVCCPQTTNKFGQDIGDNQGGNESSRTKTKQIADRECQKIIASTITPLSRHIVGGEDASPGEFPHMVALGYENGDGYAFDCGGSVVSETYVITAAHCVDTLQRIQPSIVRGGVVEKTGTQFNNNTDVRIAQNIMHPQYTRREKYHDLALLRLEKPLHFSNLLNAICLETNDENPTGSLTISGWGNIANNKNQGSDILLKANVTAVASSMCTQWYLNWRKLPRGISSGQICAADPGGKMDTCQGDSGGPLVSTFDDGHYRLVGVTSFGRGCGSPEPAVYTRVSHYIDWIASVIWPN